MEKRVCCREVAFPLLSASQNSSPGVSSRPAEPSPWCRSRTSRVTTSPSQPPGAPPGQTKPVVPRPLAAGRVRGDGGVPAPPKHPARAGCGASFAQGLRNVLLDMSLNTDASLGLKPSLLIWRMPDESRLISTGSEPIIFEQEAPFCPKAT